MGSCSMVFSVVGLILHMPIINPNERTRAGEISGLLGWCVSYCLVLVRGDSLIADRVVVPGDLSLIVWTRDGERMGKLPSDD